MPLSLGRLHWWGSISPLPRDSVKRSCPREDAQKRPLFYIDAFFTGCLGRAK